MSNPQANVQDQPGGNGHKQVEAQPLRIIVEFQPGHVDPSVHVDNGLGPAHLLIASGFLSWMAGQLLARIAQVQTQPGIAVPRMVMPKGILRG